MIEATEQIPRFPDWPEKTRGIPNVCLRSALFAVINSAAGSEPARVAPAPSTAGQALRDDFTRVRTGLEESIAIDGLLTPGKARGKLPRPDWHPSIEGAADFLPYQRYYLAHQRDMGAAITPLRASARAALAALSPAHKQLAQVDGVGQVSIGGASLPAVRVEADPARLAAERPGLRIHVVPLVLQLPPGLISTVLQALAAR